MWALPAGGGLLDCHLTTGAADNVLCGTGFDELKSIAEGIALADHRMHLYVPERQGELQPDDLSNRDFNAEHSGNA